MTRDEINPKPGDVWEGEDGQRLRVWHLERGLIHLNLPVNRYNVRTHRATLDAFRDWVGKPGKLVSRSATTNAGHAGESK